MEPALTTKNRLWKAVP